MPRHPLPTILIARLAVDRGHQGRRLGSRLLAEALRMAVGASDAVAARLVVVDAIDDAASAFYRRWGFVDMPENPLRLYRKVSDIRRSLDASSSGASELRLEPPHGGGINPATTPVPRTTS
jgi:ribosomal protein S18 acetylase RimI-like enzyme